MLALLSKIVPFGSLIKYGLIAAVIAGAGWYVWHLRSQVTAQQATITGLKSDVAQVAAISQRNALAATQAQANAAQAEATLQVFNDQATATGTLLGGQLATIKAAPAPAQAAVPPTLVWDTIAGLKP